MNNDCRQQRDERKGFFLPILMLPTSEERARKHPVRFFPAFFLSLLTFEQHMIKKFPQVDKYEASEIANILEEDFQT